MNWKPPRNVTEVISFLGLASYYRRFVRGFSVIASPLTKLLRKEIKFEWTDKCHNSFEQLIGMLVEAPVLTQPTSGKEYTLYSDASGIGLGCVLMQDGKVVIVCLFMYRLNLSILMSLAESSNSPIVDQNWSELIEE